VISGNESQARLAVKKHKSLKNCVGLKELRAESSIFGILIEKDIALKAGKQGSRLCEQLRPACGKRTRVATR
jgi:hypothetical protein